MRWWPWARRAEETYRVPPRSLAPALPPPVVAGAQPTAGPSAEQSAEPEGPGGVRLVMDDGTAVELAAGTPQARAFAAVADALVQGLPHPAQAPVAQALGHLADD